MIDVVGPYPPAIFNSGSTNRRYATSGKVWVEITEDTTYDELNWINTLDKYRMLTDKVFVIDGSKGSKYNVTVFSNGDRVCDCMGFSFRRTCKHLTMIQQKG